MYNMTRTIAYKIINIAKNSGSMNYRKRILCLLDLGIFINTIIQKKSIQQHYHIV
ncbi:hypothetical protein ABID99_003742 [Mucilaginibacter sp. OAE612]